MRSAIETTPRIHPDAFELAEILRPFWAGMSADLRASGVPLNDGDDDEVTISKKELDAFKKKAAEGDKAAKKVEAAEKAATEATEKVEALEQKLEAADDSSEVEKLTKRIERAEKAREEAEEKATKAEQKATEAETRRTGISVATRLKFRNPEKAIKLLDADDLDSESDFEQALERLAREEPYLIESKKQRRVEDPKERKNGKKDPDDDDPEGDDDEPGGDDKISGPERIRRYHEREAEKAAAKAGGSDEGGDGSE